VERTTLTTNFAETFNKCEQYLDVVARETSFIEMNARQRGHRLRTAGAEPAPPEHRVIAPGK
jgi:hypothetical protein